MIKVLMEKHYDLPETSKLAQKYGLKVYFRDKEKYPDEDILKEIEVLACWRPEDAIEKLPNLKWLHFHMAGVDMFVDKFKAMPSPPKVTNGSGTFDIPIAEHTVAMLLAHTRLLDKYIKSQPDMKWEYQGKGKEINSSTIGIVGFGHLGQYTAKLLSGFGATIYVHKQSAMELPEYVDKAFYKDEGLDEMLPECDYVLLFLPGTEKTHHLFNKERMLKMKKGAFITNVGRGMVIDCDALAELIESGHIGGAGLDVTDPEPLPEGHKLWKLENVIITPHVSYATPNIDKYVFQVFEDNIKKYIAGEKMPNEVDFSKGY